MLTTLRATLALCWALLALAPGIAAQSVYKDSKYGFSVKTVQDWNPIPVQPTERAVVAKWVSDREIRNLPGEMRVYVFDRRQKAEAAPPELTNAGGYDRPAEDDPWNPRSFESYLKLDPARSKISLEKPADLKVKAPPELAATGKLYELTRDSGYSLGGRPVGDYYVVIAIIQTPTREYTVELSVHEKETRKYRQAFLAVAKSFELHVIEATAASTGNLSPREEARQRARENAERVPGWWYQETENYLILTNMEKKPNNLLRLKDVATRLEAIRELYEIDFPPKAPIEAVSLVRVCKDEKTYFDYGGPGGSAGYWSPAAKELVLYMEGEKAKAQAVLMHEAFHQYIYYACGEISPHSWYNEGYGDYYAGAVVTQGKVRGVDVFRWRVDTIKGHIRSGTAVPLKEFVRYSQGEYYSRADLCYAQGWSLIYFFNKAVPKAHAWAKILPTYLSVLQETGNPSTAVEAAFKDVDMAALEKAWGDFIARDKPVTL